MTTGLHRLSMLYLFSGRLNGGQTTLQWKLSGYLLEIWTVAFPT